MTNAKSGAVKAPRKTIRTPEIEEELLRRIMDGETLTSICKSIGCNPSTIYYWTLDDPEFGQRFARARDFGDIVLEEQAIDITDLRNTGVETSETEKSDGTTIKTTAMKDNVLRSRLQAEVRLKVVARRKGAKITNEIRFLKRSDADAAAEMTNEQLLEIARMRVDEQEV